MTRRDKNIELAERHRLVRDTILALPGLEWPPARFRLHVTFGEPWWSRGRHSPRSLIRKTYGCFMGLRVPADWLETVHAPGLAVIGPHRSLCLSAVELPPPENADAAWRLALMDSQRHGRLAYYYLCRLGGHERLSAAGLQDAYRACYCDFKDALDGKDITIPF